MRDSRELSRARGIPDLDADARISFKDIRSQILYFMKEFVRRMAGWLVSIDTLWEPVRKTLVRGSQFLCAMRESHEADQIVAEIPKLREALDARVVIS